MTPETVEKFAASARETAAAEYDAFVAKLEAKIGDDVAAAELAGNHVWNHSTLTITRTDGSVERWRTSMIINVSKLGKLFNQFPTRKAK